MESQGAKWVIESIKNKMCKICNHQLIYFIDTVLKYLLHQPISCVNNITISSLKLSEYNIIELKI